MSIEDRLREHFAAEAAGVHASARLDELTDRLGHTQHRRMRTLGGLAAVTLVVGALGGFVSGHAFSGQNTASAGNRGAGATTASPGGAPASGAAAPGSVGPNIATGVGTLTHLFTRTTTDGKIVIRAFARKFPQVVLPTCTPPRMCPEAGAPSAGSAASGVATGSGSGTASSGSVSGGTATSGTASGNTGISGNTVVHSVPPTVPCPGPLAGSPAKGTTGGVAEPAYLVACGQSVVAELSDDSAVTTEYSFEGSGYAYAGASGGPLTLQGSGTWGTEEGELAFWATMSAKAPVVSVVAHFAGGVTDSMRTVQGVAVLAAVAATGHANLSGTVDALDAAGHVIATVHLVPPNPCIYYGGGAVKGIAGQAGIRCVAPPTTTPSPCISNGGTGSAGPMIPSGGETSPPPCPATTVPSPSPTTTQPQSTTSTTWYSCSGTSPCPPNSLPPSTVAPLS